MFVTNRCNPKGKEKEFLCYHLELMKQDLEENKNVSATLDEIDDAYDGFGCLEQDACSYAPKDKKLAEEVVLPRRCNNNNNSRKKRAVAEKVKKNNNNNNKAPVKVSDDYVINANFLTSYMRLAPETRKLIGHQFGVDSESSDDGDLFQLRSGMVFRCTYRGGDCLNEDLWLAQSSTNYGNCFTFNSAMNKGDEEAPREASLTGINYGKYSGFRLIGIRI